MLRSTIYLLIVLALVVFVGASNEAAADIYTGSLSTDGGADGLLTGVGQSWGAGTTLSWTVDTAAVGGVSYEYTLTVADTQAAGISHLNVETSPNFTSADIVSTNWPLLDLFVGTLIQNPGSPSLPSETPGIKFDNSPDAKSVTVSFISTRLPMWGDFYAKGGDANEVWNAGFGADETVAPFIDPTDPADPIGNGSIRDHLLVPDTIPEPATLTLLALGAGGMLLRRQRRRRLAGY